MGTLQVSILDLLRQRSEATNEIESRRKAQRTTLLLLTFGCVASLVVDVIVAVCLYVSRNDWSWSMIVAEVKGWTSWRDALTFNENVVDCVALALARAVFVPALGVLAANLGRPRYSKSEMLAQQQPSLSTASLNAPLLGSNGGEELASVVAPDDASTPPNAAAALTAGAAATVDAVDATRVSARSAASCRKVLVLTLLFVASVASQVYVGIKCLDFKFNGRFRDVQAVLMCLSVVFVNLEVWLVRTIVEESTRDDGLYLPHMHSHPLFFDNSLARHWCDLCSQPVYKAWRCKLCDFDACVKCVSRTDAATVGENLLRSDKGVIKEKTLSTTQYLVRALALASGEWLLFLAALVALLASAAASLVLPNSQGKIVDRIVAGDKGGFMHDIEIYLGVMILLGVFNGLKGLAFTVVGRRISFVTRNKMFERMLAQDIAFYDGTTSGRLTGRLTWDVDMMLSPVQTTLSSVLYNVVMLIGGVAMCFYTSYQLSMLAFTCVGPVLFLWDIYAKFSKRLNRLVLAALGEASSAATEALGNIRTVKAFCMESTELERYMQATRDALNHGMKDAFGYAGTAALSNYLDLGAGVLILWVRLRLRLRLCQSLALRSPLISSRSTVSTILTLTNLLSFLPYLRVYVRILTPTQIGGLLALNEPGSEGNPAGITIGRLVSFQLFWNIMNNSYQALQSVFTQFTRAAAAAERVFSLMDSLPDIDTGVAECALPSPSAAVGSSSTSPRSSEVDGGAGAAASSALAATHDPLDLRTHCRGELELRNVKFFYQMRPDRVVLNDVCLHIPAGTVCALVGRSGGGKSTIVHLLQRFYDVQGGAILFDGHDIRRYDVRILRGEIGVVAQDTPLFARTILDNIVYGLDEDSWTMTDVRDAAKQACALEFIEEFHDGFDTRVGERGARVSGGQRQRIAIARVFLRRPRVLLLDEATSALDAESESKVQDALDRSVLYFFVCYFFSLLYSLLLILLYSLFAQIDQGRDLGGLSLGLLCE